MIPNEVAIIAQELGLHYHGSAEDGLEKYIPLAWKIYERLQVEWKAEARALQAPDD